jgi:hypothetical protein
VFQKVILRFGRNLEKCTKGITFHEAL